MALEQDVQQDAREARIAQSQALDDRLKEVRLNRELEEDARAKQRQIIDEERGAQAGRLLFEIDTKAEDAERRLGEVFRDYGDIISDEKRFPRLKGQWDFNQRNFGFHRAEAVKEAEQRAAAEERRARLAEAAGAGLVRESMTVDGERLVRPDPVVSEAEKLRRAEEMSAAHARGAARGRPKSEDAEDSWVKLNAEKKAAEAMRPGLTPETARQFQKREQALISAGRDVPSDAPAAAPVPAAAPASYFKEGDTRVRDGVTWKRNANGQWHPQS